VLVVEVQLGDIESLVLVRTTLGAIGYDACLHIGKEGRLRDTSAPFPWAAYEQNFLFVHPSDRVRILDLLNRARIVSP
jgi:hypothetical protein